MLTTEQLLDVAKQRHGVSDYKLSQLLDVVPSAVKNYRAGRSHPDDRVCRKLAELTGHDAGMLAVWMQAERSRDDAARSMWEGIAARLERAGLATVAAVLLASGLGLAADDADAHPPLTGGSLYIMSNGWCGLLASLRAWLARRGAWRNPPAGGLQLA